MMKIRFLRNTGVADKNYKTGNIATLSDAIAKDFIRKGRAEAVKPAEFASGGYVRVSPGAPETAPEPSVSNAEQPLKEGIPDDPLPLVIIAMTEVDPGNADNFTEEGAVRCDVLSDICGFAVSADMRDAAVTLLQRRMEAHAKAQTADVPEGDADAEGEKDAPNSDDTKTERV